MTKKIKYLLVGVSCLVLGLVSIHGVSALDVGTKEITNTIQLTSDSPIKIAARIINIFMMFLGTIAVSLVVFAGFKWMTSKGNEEQIEAAKKILKNAVIGLVIILSSWGIVTFILSRLIGDTGSGGLGTESVNQGGVGLGAGALGSCTVQNVYPEPEQKEVPRTIAVIITLKEDVDLSTVCVNASDGACACDNTSACSRLNQNNFKIFEGSGAPASASTTAAIVSHPAGDSRTLVVKPILPLGSPSNNVWYSVYLSNDIKATTGCPSGAASCGLFDTCAADYYRWQFEVSNKLDLTPPQITVKGVFPEPDDNPDIVTINSAASAFGSFKVNDKPRAYIPAAVLSVVTSTPGQSATVVLENNYNETAQTIFSVTSIKGNRAQLYKESNSLGVADFNSNNSVNFPGYFTLTVGGDGAHPIGNMWKVTVSAAQKGDTIIVGADTYNFISASSSGYNIKIDSNPAQEAINIAAALSSRSDVSASVDSGDVTIDIQAKISGFAGNSINLDTDNHNFFTVNQMHGGVDADEVVVVKDLKDKPMNSTLQINFNEAVNPVTVSGNAGDVSQTIQVVNADNLAKSNGGTCVQNSDCASYNCENNFCSGNYLDGKFEISNGYKTLEFRTNNECGMNGCGEKIYCLPANSHLQVRITTASLVDCDTDDDCAAEAPFTACVNSAGLFKSCRDTSGLNHPLAKIIPMIGVMDSSFNALDGNRDKNADGPIGFYDENVQNVSSKDNYLWSFFINSQIDTTPPKVRSIFPAMASSNVSLSDPIIIEFNKLIMSSSLKSGSLKSTIGSTTVEHKLLNLRSTTNAPTGYWTTSENLDFSPLDGQPDITRAKINHSMFGESIDYVSQAGSGVKDIFQNCFKPSSGPDCIATQENPSCCNGTSTSILDDGNCAINN